MEMALEMNWINVPNRGLLMKRWIQSGAQLAILLLKQLRMNLNPFKIPIRMECWIVKILALTQEIKGME
jgi:hypothetical protein